MTQSRSEVMSERSLFQHSKCNLDVAERAAQSVSLYHLHGNHKHGDYLKLRGTHDSMLMRVTDAEWSAYVRAYESMSKAEGRTVSVIVLDVGYHSYGDSTPYEKPTPLVDATNAPTLSYQPG